MPRTLAMFHYASPPVVGGVESTLGHHARILADRSWLVHILSGEGAAFDARIPFHLEPLIGSQHPDVLARAAELAAGEVTPAFHAQTDAIAAQLRGALSGVETGLLIDMLDRFGLGAIAQTDLEVRVHHNQPLEGLSRMAFAILQVFIARIEKRTGLLLLDQAQRSLKLIVQEPDRFGLAVQPNTDRERPPIVRYPAYRKAHAPQG